LDREEDKQWRVGHMDLEGISEVAIQGENLPHCDNKHECEAERPGKPAAIRERALAPPKLLKDLVDLVGIEPTISSMPWEYQPGRPLIIKTLMAG
jgi:hypothetical protein